MHIIIGVGAAIALLYFWLIGHWFARVLVFPLLGGVLGLGGAALFSLVYTYNPVGNIFGGVLGITAAWFVSGIPLYYWRHRFAALLPERKSWWLDALQFGPFERR